MKTRSQNKRCKNVDEASRGGEGKLPVDILEDVFKRLSPRDVARFRCVSISWNRLMRQPYFVDKYLNFSSPRLLFTISVNGGRSFHSVDITREEGCSTANKKYPFKSPYFNISNHVNGLVCVNREMTVKKIKKTRTQPIIEVYNPSSGECLVLPSFKTKIVRVKSFLGFDPLKREYKVLAMVNLCTWLDRISEDYHVLTLGFSKLNWRKVHCDFLFRHPTDQRDVCIDGVIFFITNVYPHDKKILAVVGFELPNERFLYVKKAEGMSLWDAKIVDYKGKLGALVANVKPISKSTTLFELWVVEDLGESRWSKYLHFAPPMWKTVVSSSLFSIEGLSLTGDVILKQTSPEDYDHFGVLVCNLDRLTVRKVVIQGLDVV
ncbi:unnamed protein product [Cochlearia groenlandica]